DQLKTLATRGPAYGIRFVVTGSKSTDIRFNLASSFPGRIEMRLTDPMDSQFGRKAAERMPEDRPGRSMIAGELFAHAALPRIDAVADTDDLSRGIREATAAIAASTTGRARQVRLLPRIVTPADLRPDPLRPELVPVGLEESSVKTHYFDLLDRDANVMVLGESETGKTTLLKYLVEQMLARHTPNELVIAVFDPKRNLRDVFPPEYVGGYASSVAVAGGLVQGIIPDLDSRVPRTVESQDSAETMAGKPRILMVMDDYDMIQMAGTNLLGELRRHIALSAEIRFQIFLTRRIQGASRALFDAGFSALRDSGAVGVQLSGDRAEGMLLGNVRPTKMPPGRGQVIRSGYAPEIVQFVLPTS
nr:type VII secretion protein EccC [Actinomycetales bacterium]